VLANTPPIHNVHGYYSLALEDGDRLTLVMVEFADRLAIWMGVQHFPSLGAADSRSLKVERYTRMKEFARRSTFFPFRRFLSRDACLEFMQRLFVVPHGALGPCLRFALHEGGASAIACLRAPRT
jgi:hypothetical protein